MRPFVLLLLVVICRGQDDEVDESFELTGDQIKQCTPLGYISDPDDCCWYIQCLGVDPWTRGVRVACMGGAVWSSLDCACVQPSAAVGCDPASCNVPEFIAKNCTEFLADEGIVLTEDQCCIDARIYNKFNLTSFYLEGEDPVDHIQTCPYEVEFNQEDCCCGGDDYANQIQTGALGEDFASRCSCFPFDDPMFYNEGVQPSGAGFVAGGAAGSAGAISFAAGTAAGGASAKLYQFSNVAFETGFAVGGWVKSNGDGNALLFHNGGAGGAGATVKFEMSTSGSGGGGGGGGGGGTTTFRGGALGSDGASDFEWSTTSWSTGGGGGGGGGGGSSGEWNHWAASYDNGEWSFYANGNLEVQASESADYSSVEGRRQQSIGADEATVEAANDEAIRQVVEASADEAIAAAGEAKEAVSGFRSRRRQSVGSDFVPDDTDDRLGEILDCIETIKQNMEGTKAYLQDIIDGLTNFKKSRRSYRRAFNQFCRPKRRNEVSRDTLEENLRKIRNAYNKLLAQVEKICESFQKVCDILDDREILKQIDSESKKTLRKLKRKLGNLKARFNDENPDGDARFGLRAVDSTFPEADEKIRQFDLDRQQGRRKRQADGPVEKENKRIVPSKEPVTIGDNLNGDMDELCVCNFPLDQPMVDDLFANNENPMEPMF